MALLSGPDRILVVNAGSTSLKLVVVAEDGTAEHVDSLAACPSDIQGVGHRIVHGGARFVEPVLVDDAVEAELAELTELAPLHNAAAIETLAEARRRLPHLPHVAVFDTSFHATMPEIATNYALPARLREQHGIRRYGFHGLSVQWASEQVTAARLIVCHLGGGCSITAVQAGRSVDTTMGFSPLEGVPMATRSGSVDPGALLHLLRTGAATAEELDDMLERKSGLLGLSGVSGDVDRLESVDLPQARLALAVYCYRIAGAVAAMTTALGGLEALVFTGGVGENSHRVRADVCRRLRFLDVELDADANRAAHPDADVSAEDSGVRVTVLRSREDIVIACATRRALAAGD